MLKENNTKIAHSICTMCRGHCRIDAHVKDGKVIRVTRAKGYPSNKLCVKAQGIVDWLYSPERITTPLRKRDGTWEKISWDEAFGIISDKLNNIKENYILGNSLLPIEHLFHLSPHILYELLMQDEAAVPIVLDSPKSFC